MTRPARTLFLPRTCLLICGLAVCGLGCPERAKTAETAAAKEAAPPPIAFPPGVTPKALRQRMQSALIETFGPHGIETIDCEEYPCIVYARFAAGKETVEAIFRTLVDKGVGESMVVSQQTEGNPPLGGIAVGIKGGRPLIDPDVQLRFRIRSQKFFETAASPPQKTGSAPDEN